ncbi:LysR family transcriptional regulator [Curvibacter sp. APW13]|uniref:LysR family transcriptional regulator n=1 Tax=Curvibacter sp. APW13 TaxID=3077236 RepID=UPI0028DE7E2C|nr:LysR family transcriptional regulator [Curvibacter sp. APW13]MDT8990846.1 LysR family transcriptional regulator [Curvibacter sp. APW13]
MNPRFDWSLVRSFLAVLDHGSLLAAARALNTSQPTLGRHIAELESQLGVVLFERTGRALVPTATALGLADSARAMEQGAQALAHRVGGAHTETTGTVRITASVPVAVHLLPQVLAAMRLALPGIAVELVASNQVSNLLRREADIAVRMVRPEQGSLVARKIGEVQLGAWAHRDYLARHPPLRSPQDLLALDLIGSDTDTSILRGFAAMGFAATPQHFALRSDDFVVQVRAAQAGYGVGFLADYTVRDDPAMVKLLPQQLRIPALPMWLAVHREIRTNARIRAVYDFLAEALPPRL